MVSISYEAAHGNGNRAARRPGVAALALLLFGLVLAGAGFFRIAGLPWDQLRTALDARSWPAAEARIVSAELTEILVPGPDGTDSELALSVEYEFEAAGRTVTGSSASLKDRSGPEDRRLVRLFRKAEFARITGGTVPASYDPNDPARAFLDPDLPWKDILPGFGLGVALLLLGGQIAGGAAARFRSQRPAH